MVLINDNKAVFYFISKDYDKDYLFNVKRKNSKGNIVSPWVKYHINVAEVRREIKDINDDEKGILSSYYLDKNCFSLYDLNYKKIYLKPKNNLNEIEFDINKISIHSFESGISYIELDYTIKTENEKDINTFNYFISEVKSGITIKIINKKWNEDKKETEDFIGELFINDYIKLILSDYDNVYDLDFDNCFKYMSLKPTVFSYIYLKDCNEQIIKNVGVNMKESYKINNEFTKKTTYFENSSWYYNPNSVINISYCVEDEITNDFFKTTFRDKVANLYFLLFLISLHQKIYLIYNSYVVKNINYSTNDYIQMKDLCDSIILLKSRILQSKVKYFFSNPTFIEHVNLFYVNVQSSFLIVEMKQTLENDLVLISEFVESNVKLITDYRELKQEKRKCLTDVISILIATILSFVSLYDVFLKMLNNFNISLNTTQHLIIATIFMMICLVIPTYFNLKNNIKKLRSIKNKMFHLNKLIISKK